MARTLQPDSRISHYRIVGPLGTGGMGEVYLAKDETLERNVALKILPPELVRSEDRVRRFMLEAKSASSLNHPHIVTIYEVGRGAVRAADGSEDGATTGEVHYIAMELITGRTFKDLVHTDGTDLRTLLGYFAQAAEGLSKAHAAGIVHRDLKPGNIMVTSDGYAKVLDFGLAKLTEKTSGGEDRSSAPTEVADRTSAGAILGTVGYMSPEQVRGKGVDHRSDIFSFGCILYEATTRKRPFEAESDIDTMHRILHDTPTPIDQLDDTVPAELRRIIRRCMAKAADQRFQSMKDLAIELREIADEYDTLSASLASASMIGRAPAEFAARRRPSRARYAAWGAALLGGMALAYFGLMMAGRTGTGAAAPPFMSIRMSSLLSMPALQAAMISPDGRYLAYIAGATGNQRLRVRQIATGTDLDVLPPTTEQVRSPSFSPDGNYIFYLQRDPEAPNYAALFDVPSLGGTPRKRLFDVDSGVSFDPNGRLIAFVRGVPQKQGTDLIVADLGSGQERALATVAHPEIMSPFVRPAWSLDGRLIVSAIQQMGGGLYTGLATFDVTDGTRRDIPHGGSPFLFIDSVAWLPDGRGLVITGAALDSLSPQVRHVSYPDGASRPITSDLNLYGSVSVASSQGSLAAIRATGSGDLWAVPVDGASAAKQITYESSRSMGDIVTMKDGSIVFTANDGSHRRLFTMRDDGSQLRAITSGLNYAVGPVLPYKDEGVVFTLFAGNPIVGHVHRVDRDGGNLTQLTKGTGEHLIEASPDGSTILYRPVGAPTDVWIVSGAGEPRLLVQGVQGGPKFSPDGKWILYPMFKEKEGRVQTVWTVVPAEGGDPMAEIDIPGVAFGFDWAPDGSVTYGRTIQGVGNLWRQPLPAGEPAPLTRFTEGQLETWRWSPDGSMLLVSRRLGLDTTVELVPAEGGNAKFLSNPRIGDMHSVHFSHDLSKVFFVQGEQKTDVVQISDTQGQDGS